MDQHLGQHDIVTQLEDLSQNVADCSLDDYALKCVHQTILSPLLKLHGQLDAREQARHLLRHFPVVARPQGREAHQNLQLLYLRAIFTLLTSVDDAQKSSIGDLVSDLVGKICLQLLSTDKNERTEASQDDDNDDETEDRVAQVLNTLSDEVSPCMREACTYICHFMENLDYFSRTIGNKEDQQRTEGTILDDIFVLCMTQMVELATYVSGTKYNLPGSAQFQGSYNTSIYPKLSGAGLFSLLRQLLSVHSSINKLDAFKLELYPVVLEILSTDKPQLRKKVINEIFPHFFLSDIGQPEKDLAQLRQHIGMLWERIYHMASLGDSFAVDAYLLVAKFFELFFSSKLSFDLRNEERFWTFLQKSFLSDDNGIRKCGNYLLKRIIEHSKSALKYPNTRVTWTKYFFWDKKREKELQKLWDTFFLFQETLEEFNYHLVEPVWPQLSYLFSNSSKIKGKDAGIHVSWPLCIAARGAKHENPTIKKHVVCDLLAQKPQDVLCISSPFSLVITCPIMDALCDSLFFKGNLNALIHRVLLSFLETYFSLIGYKEAASLSEDVLKQKQASFVRQFLASIRARRPFVSGALELYLTFLHSLPPLPVLYSTQNKEEESPFDHLSAIMENHICFQPQAQRRALYNSIVCLLKHMDTSRISFHDIQRIISAIPPKHLDKASKGWMQLRNILSSFSPQSWLFDNIKLAVSNYLEAPEKTTDFIATQVQSTEKLHEEAASVGIMFSLLEDSDQQINIFSLITGQIGPHASHKAERAFALLGSTMDSLLATKESFPKALIRVLGEATAAILNYIQASLSSLQDVRHKDGLQQRKALERSSIHLVTISQVFRVIPHNELLKQLVASLLQFILGYISFVGKEMRAQDHEMKYYALQCLDSVASHLFSQDVSEKGIPIAETDIQTLIKVVTGSSLRPMPSHLSSSERREWGQKVSEFLHLKWHCLSQIIAGPYPLSSSFTPPSTQDLVKNLHLTKNLASYILEESLEGLNSVGPGSFLHLLRCLQACIVPALVEGEGKNALVDNNEIARVLDTAWMALKDDRDFDGTWAFISLAFQPSLLQIPSLSAQESSPLKKYFNEILELGELYRGVTGRLAESCCLVWSRDASIASLYVPEIVQLVTFGPNRKGDNDMAGAALSNDSAFMQDYYVRGLINAWLWNIQIGEDESGRAERDFIGRLFGELLDLSFTPKFVNEARIHSQSHRRRIRLWQTITLLSKKCLKGSILELFREKIWAALDIPNLRSVRSLLELSVSHMMLHYSTTIDSFFFNFISRVNDKPEIITSGIVLSGIMLRWMNINNPDYIKIWRQMAVYVTCHHLTIRTVAQVAFSKIVDSRPDFIQSLSEGEREEVLAQHCYMKLNGECKRGYERHSRWVVPSLHPEEQITPEVVLYKMPLDEHLPSGEAVHPDIFEAISQYLQTGSLPSQLAILTDTKESEASGDTEEAEDLDEAQGAKKKATAKEGEAAFQKKITPWTAIKFDEEIARTHLLERKKRQPLIVVASLIDKIPNLAGLSRTCEIFNASCLVLPNLKVTQNHLFQSVSVTAERWVPLQEVPEKDLTAYLKRKKEEGFTLLGVEQTSNSISLDQFSFPRKTLLLLGKEKQGIPVEYIHLLDACIEIPQLGIIRSLNVHVSASILIWEYTRQQQLAKPINTKS